MNNIYRKREIDTSEEGIHSIFRTKREINARIILNGSLDEIVKQIKIC